MHQDILLNTEIDILVLLMVACLAAISLRKINFPYYGEINYYWSNGEDSPDLAIAFPHQNFGSGGFSSPKPNS